MSTRRRAQSGQSLVELALVVPLMVLLFMGTVEVGRILFAQIALEEAVHEGATYAAQAPTDAAGITLRVTTSSDHGEVAGATVATPVCTTSSVTLSASHDLPTITPLGSVLFGGTFEIGSIVVATNLQGACT